MAEHLMVYEPGDRVATMGVGGQVRIWEVSASGEWELREGGEGALWDGLSMEN